MSEPGAVDLVPKDRPLSLEENMDLQNSAFTILKSAFDIHPRIQGIFDWEADEATVVPSVPAPKRIYEGGRIVTPDHIEIHLNTTNRRRGIDDPQGEGIRFRRPKFGYAGEQGLLSEYILYDRTHAPLVRRNTVQTARDILRFARSLRGAK